MSQRQLYTVVDTQPVSPTVMVYTMRSTNILRPLIYVPGQYATLRFSQHGRPTPARCFSIMSSPTEPDLLQFGMRVHGDYTTTAARTLRPGSKVHISGPYGHFTFNPRRDRVSVMLAGGIGVAPFMSMIRYATKMQLPNDILLVYSSRDQNDIPFMDELLYAQSVNPHFRVVFALSGGSTTRLEGLPFIYGPITPQAIYGMLGGAMMTPTYFVCGPAGFMDAMVRGLRDYHVPEQRIFTEAFNTRGQRAGAFVGWPSHVYALTALGVAFGTGSTLMGDILTPAKQVATKKAGATNTNGTGSSTRQNDVDGTITDLQGQGDTITVDTDGDGVVDTTVPVDNGNTGNADGGTSTGGGGSSGGGTSVGGGGSSGGGSTGGGSGGGSAVSKPVVNLSLGANSIIQGSSTTLSWSVSGTSPTCTASGGWSGGKGTSGSVTVNPSSTATYTLTCSNSAGSASQSITLTVTSAPVAPSITITVSPSTITAGQSTTLSWSVSGTSPTCTASGGWSGGKNASGSLSVNPATTTSYTLACSNAAGGTSKSATVTVNPVPVVVKPTISFSASTTTITAGQSATLNWSVSGTSPTCTASGGWSGGKAISGSQSVSPGTTTTYNLSCSNSAGSDAKSVTINVNPVSGGS